MATITQYNDPRFFAQVVQGPRWVEAMKGKVEALEENGT